MGARRHFELNDRVAVVGIVVGIAVAVASVALPFAYPDLLPAQYWRVVLWISIAGIINGVLYLFIDLSYGPRVAIRLFITGSALAIEVILISIFLPTFSTQWACSAIFSLCAVPLIWLST